MLGNPGFYYSGGHWDWPKGGCGQGGADYDDIVLSPSYEGGLNGCSSDSWLACMPQLEAVRLRLDALVPGATFSWIGRSRHHQWLVLENCAARIGELTEGRINVQYFAAGERVGAFDSFDEVASGNAQAYIGADYYWKGKHPAWAYFTAVPFGLTYAEIDAWIKYGGGQELWDELGAEFGVKNFAAGNTGAPLASA